jgi:quercetin dioxygenase-like cupin family protein
MQLAFNRERWTMRPALLLAVAMSLFGPLSAVADDDSPDPGVRTTKLYLLRPAPPGKAVRIVRLDIGPHKEIRRHCHSGDEIGVVSIGTLKLQVEGGGYRTKHQGERFNVARGRIMTVKNTTSKAAQLI